MFEGGHRFSCRILGFCLVHDDGDEPDVDRWRGPGHLFFVMGLLRIEMLMVMREACGVCFIYFIHMCVWRGGGLYIDFKKEVFRFDISIEVTHIDSTWMLCCGLGSSGGRWGGNW